MNDIERLAAWFESRGRLKGRFVAEVPVDLEKAPRKNCGLKRESVREIGREKKRKVADVFVDQGYCPCSVCGHRFMFECEEADPPCECCSSVCT